MLRNVLAVVAGYLVMFVTVVVSYLVAYTVMGAERAFQPGSYYPAGAWIAVMFALGLLAAVLGGWLCALIARGGRAPIALAVVVLVLGVLLAIPVLAVERSPESLIREGGAGGFEAMQRAHQPAWVALLNPVVGAVGVLAGSRLRRGSSA